MSFRHLSHILSGAAVLLLAATACTQDELADDTRLPEGEYPLIINATGLQAVATPASTRATVDGNWDGVTSVALSVGGVVKEYSVTTTDTEKKTATLSRENDPFWWTSRDPITVSAWWPFDNADITQMPAVKVAGDQSKLTDYQKSDFIAAIDKTVQFDTPTLEFSHRTARITVLLKPGDGITSVTGADVYVTGLSTDKNNPATIKTYAPGTDTYEALAAPQTVKANTPFIQVDLGGGTYYFRPKNDVVLAAGSRYTYTVNVNATGLTLEGCTIGGWTDGGSESGTAEDLGYFIQDDGSYTVYTANGLLAWNEAAQKDQSINCTLSADINMAGKEWTRIDIWPGYSGIFNGQGHRITGLSLSADCTELFGILNEDGVIKNLQLVDVNLYGNSGGAAGIVSQNNGQIIACSVTGKISAYSTTCGIANSNYGSIIACWFDGTLKENECGAIVDYNYSTITSCYWGGNAGQGVYHNQVGTVDVTKVDGVTVKWQTAVDGMNPALTGNDYQWTSGTDGLPVLKKK